MKKILFVIGSTKIGGAEVGMIEIVNELCNDYEIDICFFKKEGPLLERIPKNVNVISIYKPNDSRIIKKLKRRGIYNGSRLLYALTIKKKYDVEIAFIEGTPAMFVASSTNKSSVKIASIRVDLTNYQLDVEKVLKDKGLVKMTNAYKKFDYVYGVSDQTTKSFINKFPDCKDKALTINTYFDKKRYMKMADENFNEYNKDVFNIVSVGRMSVQKGYERIIEITDYLDKNNVKYNWHIIGRYSDNYGKNLAQKLSKNKNVILDGEKNNPYPYIKNADLLISTSLYEGYPRVVNEAITLETPVITTNVSGTKEIVNDKYGIVCDSIDDMKVNTLKIINDKKLYNSLKNNLKSFRSNKKQFYNKLTNMFNK